tara:strand:- start:12128 stop:12829 length:702 start_codon:yes stop_codon:yes gene_type:complete
VIVFDIETTSLGADMGYCLAIGWRELGKKRVHCPTVLDFKTYDTDVTNDKELVEYGCSELAKADVLVGHYSTKFDYPFLQARLLYHDLPPMPPIPHVDTWRLARYKMRLQSNGLDNVSKFFECKDRKTPLAKSVWRRAQAGYPDAIEYVKQHCIADVKVTEEVYEKTKVLSTTHPNLNLVNDRPDSCPICSGGPMQKRGFNIARTGKKQRYQCGACFGWSSGPPIRSSNITIR